MQTYHYRFPASGKTQNQPTFLVSMLENKMKEGPDCLGVYAMFERYNGVLNHVSMEMDKNDITAVNVYTNIELWEGNDHELWDCVQCNLDSIAEEQGIDEASRIQVKEPMEALGREGEMSKHLYHITEEKNLESIMEKGLEPRQGHNAYKVHEDYVCLIEKQDIVAWATMLPHLDNPVVLEVSTDGLEGIEPGRCFERGYLGPDGCSEYRTPNQIPPSNIARMEMTPKVQTEFLNTMNTYLERANMLADMEDVEEAERGLNRINDMIETKEVRQGIDRINSMAGNDEWDSEKVGEGLADALAQMPQGAPVM